jgi:hypothetical protein
VVAAYLADPRRTPYLLIWIESAFNSPVVGQPREAVRLGPFSFSEGETPAPGWVEVKRWKAGLRVLERPLPRHTGKTVLLICSRCDHPRRALYAQTVRFASSLDWLCRQCAELRYASEGGALVFRTRSRVTRPLSGLRLTPRPEVWEPLVFTSPVQALDLGLVQRAYSDGELSKLLREQCQDRHYGA